MGSELFFIGGIAFAIFVVATWTYYQLATKQTPSGFDFLLPVVLVAFEGIVELCRKILDVLEEGVDRLISSVMRLFGR